MARTTKPTRVWAKYGVYGRASDTEDEILTLADDFRADIVAAHHAYRKRVIEFRNHEFPEVYAALIEIGFTKAEIYILEASIKQLHSEKRDRDAITVQQKARLKEFRAQLAKQTAAFNVVREPWAALLQAFKDEFKAQLSEDTRQRIKTIAKRRAAYADLVWSSDQLRRYAEESLEHDMHLRQVNEAYQALGLSAAIREEINEATKPKIGKTGPGTRYQYHREPNCRPWTKLTTRFTGGLPVASAFSGSNKNFSITPIYTNHPRGGDETICEIKQQIGTASHPKTITYNMKLDKALPDGCVIQRWSLVQDSVGKRSAFPIITTSAEVLRKPTGEGTVAFDLRWTRVEGGVLACRFLGTHVREDLVLPTWLISKRMSLKHVTQQTDLEANKALEDRGISCSKEPGERHGTDALEDYCEENPFDTAASNLLHRLLVRQRVATARQRQAVRCIEKIYETVVRRVCSLHSHIIADEIDLTQLKKYDKRDLTKGSMPEAVRELMHAVSPGKLRALMNDYGLIPLSKEEIAQALPNLAETAAGTDLFSSFVLSLGRKTGRKEQGMCRRTQHESLQTS